MKSLGLNIYYNFLFIYLWNKMILFKFPHILEQNDSFQIVIYVLVPKFQWFIQLFLTFVRKSTNSLLGESLDDKLSPTHS